MKKIISFSVWGADPKYIKGCFANIELAKQIYPDWQTRFYCAQDVPKDVICKIVDMGGEVVEMYYENSAWEGLFWRFLPASEDNVDIFISRDIDSRINSREAAAVNDWLESDKDIHCMRDHVEHNVPILGGMWGCRNGVLSHMGDMINSWPFKEHKGSDQEFLHINVFNLYHHTILAHDKFHNGMTMSNGKIQTPYLAETADFNNKNNRNPPYFFNARFLFGEHDCRDFPPHEPMMHGIHVGEIIE